jgi:hypothetical protein
MAESYQGIISEIRNEGRKCIITRLLKKLSVDEVAEILEMKPSEIEDMLNN